MQRSVNFGTAALCMLLLLASPTLSQDTDGQPLVESQAEIVVLQQRTSSNEAKYLLTHPTVIQSSEPFSFFLTLFRADDYQLPVRFQATLKRNGQDVVSQTFVQNKYGLQKHIFSKLDVLAIPLDSSSSLAVNVTFLSGDLNSFAGEMVSSEHLAQEKYVFIQTDKPTYRPGQQVKIVVLVVAADLKPVRTGSISMEIKDTYGNIMQEMDDVSLNHFGVVEFALTLSSFTSLGDWTIYVTGSSNIPEARKSFSVQFAVLPEIEVSVVFPTGYLVYSDDDRMYRGFVSGTYSSGKAVAGSVVVTLLSTGCNWRYDHPQSNMRRFSYSVDVRGNGLETDGLFTLKGLNAVVNPEDPNNGIVISRQCSLTFGISFTELASGKVYVIQVTSQMYSNPYAIQAHPSNYGNLKPGLPYTARFLVTKADGTPLDNPKDVKVATEVFVWTDGKPFDGRVACSTAHTSNKKSPLALPDKKRNLKTDADGVVTITLSDTAKEFHSALFKMWLVEYPEVEFCDTHYSALTHSGKAISLARDQPIPSPLPKVGNVVTFKIKVTYRTEWVYFILSENGQAITYQHLTTPDSQTDSLTTFSTQVVITREMAPMADAVVWTIEPRTHEILADWHQFDIDGLAEQKVEASFSPSTVAPGGETLLSVSVSEANSLIMLLAVDKRLIGQPHASHNQFTIRDVLDTIAHGNQHGRRHAVESDSDYETPCFFRTSCWPRPHNADSVDAIFRGAKMAVYSNLDTSRRLSAIPYIKPPTSVDDTAAVSQLPTRSAVTDTWIWLLASSDNQGQLMETLVAPKVVSSYDLNVLAVGLEEGFGGVPEPVELKVFKNFYVALDAKSLSIKRNEQVQLEILVFNYQSSSITATIELKKSLYFEVLVAEPSAARDNSFRSTDFAKSGVEVPPNSVTAVPVWVRALSVGSIPFEIEGYIEGDEMTRDVIVATVDIKAEGKTFYATKSVFIDLHQTSSDVKTTILVDKMFGSSVSSIVPDSKVFRAQAVASPLGVVLASLNQLVVLPSGCGEQTMATMAPNVYLYSYLRTVGALTTELAVTLRTYAQEGYLNELQYQRRDGGFSAFGEADQHSSTWLTAFVVQVLKAAERELGTFVDPNVMESAVNFLSNQLLSDGTFREDGRDIHIDMFEGKRGHINLAAYIYATYGEMGKAADKSTRNLLVSIATDPVKSDTYQLALLSYAFSLEMHPDDSNVAAVILETLLQSADYIGDDMMYWKPSDASPVVDEYTKLGQSAVETASYAVLALLKHRQFNNALKVTRWLMTQRNSFGGFSTSQDTVVGLKALAAISTQLAASGENMQIDILYSYDDAMDPAILNNVFNINTSNAMVMQTFDLPTNRQALDLVEINAAGTGVALVQLSAQYNLKKYSTGCFAVHSQKISGDVDDQVVVKTCIRTTERSVPGMVIIEVGMMTGMKADLDATGELNMVKDSSDFVEPISSIELGSSSVIYYLFGAPPVGEEVCVTSVLLRDFPTRDCDPPIATAYSYYLPDKCFTSQPFSL